MFGPTIKDKIQNDVIEEKLMWHLLKKKLQKID